MANLTIYRLLLLLLLSSFVLAIADASTYHTSVTIDDLRPNSLLFEISGKCREQIQQQDLSSCEQYFTQGGGRDHVRRAAHPLIRRIVLNTDPAEKCCRQLNEMDKRCHCEAMVEIVEQQLEKAAEAEGDDWMKIYQRAAELVDQCGTDPSCLEEEKVTMHMNRHRRNGGSCREQIERQDLSECERHLTEGIRGVDRLRQNTHLLKGCCKRLERLDERCQCKGIEEIVRRQRERWEGEEEELGELTRRARELPDACDLRASCQI
ncbi:2S seed storage albumin protein-like [Malania oleifera]|uniref:2S seed storage albumin protein-like n=1 Tax=Malania oleifera TaxID=397392 RepID=UPI0025ADA433|nr:2S seed storage albumin protein-like [Malania oleifera]